MESKVLKEMSQYLSDIHEKKEREMEVLKEDGGFFDLSEQKICMDPSHYPPTHLYVPPGKGYTHYCPSCGVKSVITSPIITC